MLLRDKVAVIYGAGGTIGSAVARAFAREGARVFLAGRTLATVEAVARDIAGAEAVQVDVLDETAVERHAVHVVATAGRIDVAFNAVGLEDVQGVALLDMPIDDFMHPILVGARMQLLTARAVARHMVTQGSGVVLTITAGPPDATPYVGGFAPACGAIEHLWRGLAAELSPRGVRFICLRSAGSPDTPDVQATFAQHAKATGRTLVECLAEFGSGTLMKRLPLLAEVVDMATVLASDRARAMTGTFVNVTCGSHGE
ncbi:MAG TPA: SDR family oxidoreductase [Candidatus Binatia bacterium]|jgi:NAD(P)-dependent dehydrogenase (short-subunit alcohol dehydrogenase family)|nr:SDR family oxidoreductase [Candidatus Binatia bacterium]